MPYRSYDAYLAHPIFRAAMAVAMRRAGGLCACGRAATEVHHHRPGRDRYPPWGMFDLPSNLRPICHECHAKEHGKTS
jgi:hypothetical protein